MFGFSRTRKNCVLLNSGILCIPTFLKRHKDVPYRKCWNCVKSKLKPTEIRLYTPQHPPTHCIMLKDAFKRHQQLSHKATICATWVAIWVSTNVWKMQSGSHTLTLFHIFNRRSWIVQSWRRWIGVVDGQRTLCKPYKVCISLWPMGWDDVRRADESPVWIGRSRKVAKAWWKICCDCVVG